MKNGQNEMPEVQEMQMKSVAEGKSDLLLYCSKILQDAKIPVRDYEDTGKIQKDFIESVVNDEGLLKEDFVIKMCLLENDIFSCYTNNRILRYWTKGQAQTPVHLHDYIEMIYVIKGGLTQNTVGNEEDIRQGDFCIVGKKNAHFESNMEEGTIIVWLCFSAQFFENHILNRKSEITEIERFIENSLDERRKSGAYIVLHPVKKIKYIEEVLYHIVHENHEKYIGYEMITKILAVRLFRSIGNQYDYTMVRKDTVPTHEQLFFIIDLFVKENLANISIAKLQKHFFFSRNHFSKIIKENTGLTYTEYIQNLRLKRSTVLLLNTNLAIGEIIEIVGLKNKKYFYDIFYEKYHMTPREYRKMYKIL